MNTNPTLKRAPLAEFPSKLIILFGGFRHRQRHDFRLQHPDADRLVLLQHHQRDGLPLYLLALPRTLRTDQASRFCTAKGLAFPHV